MGYAKQNFTDGQVLKAEHLIKMEEGIINAEKSGGGGGTSVTVDSELSSTSENPVQNKVIQSELAKKQDTLVSGTNIKTVNGQSLLGEGDIPLADIPDETISSAVETWLEAHPEATTTVSNKSITRAKLADGVGEAVDKAKTLTLEEMSPNVLFVAKLVSGAYPSMTTGEIKEGTDSSGYTGYVPCNVEGGKTYYLWRTGHVVFYDTDGNYISGANVSTAGTVAPDTAKQALVKVKEGTDDLTVAYFSTAPMFTNAQYALPDQSERSLFSKVKIVPKLTFDDFDTIKLTSSAPYSQTNGDTIYFSTKQPLFAPKGLKIYASWGRVMIYVYSFPDAVYETRYQHADTLGKIIEISEDKYIRIVRANEGTTALSDDDKQKLVDTLHLTMNNIDEGVGSFVSEYNGLISNSTAITFVGNKLYVFPYNTDDTHATMFTGAIYTLMPNDTLRSYGSFTTNVGHANTVDYCLSNGCMVIGNGGGSANTQPNEFYIFPDAENLASFDVNAETTIRIDVSQEDWGKQLNVLWGDENNGRYDIVYCLTNYEEGNMDSYAQSNPNGFTGESKRFIRRVQLGKGSNNLGSGTLIEGVSDDAFNGTYKVLKVFEREFVKAETNNDSCFYNGCVYENVLDPAEGYVYLVHHFDDMNDTVTTERKFIILYDETGENLASEGEGIAIYKDKLYINNSAERLSVYRKF